MLSECIGFGRRIQARPDGGRPLSLDTPHLRVPRSPVVRKSEREKMRRGDNGMNVPEEGRAGARIAAPPGERRAVIAQDPRP